MKVCIFFTLYILSVYCNSVFSFKYEVPSHYINPSDPNYDRVTKTIRKHKSLDEPAYTPPDRHEKDKPNRTYENEILKVLMYYRRTVNIMLNLIELNEDTGTYQVNLKSTITQEQYDILKQFGSGKDKEYLEKLSMLDEAISKLLTNTIEYDIFYSRFNFGSFNFNIITVIISVIIFIFCVYILLVKHSFKLSGLLMILLFFIFCVSYVWTFFNLVEDEEIQQITEQMKYSDFPADCAPETFSFWRLLGFSPDYKNKCLKYFRAHEKTPWKSVTPQRVISEIFGQTFSTSIVHFGNAIVDIISNVNDKLPFPYNIIFLPLVLITTVILIVILLGYHFEFSILYSLIKFKFGNHPTIIYQQSRIEDVQVKGKKKKIKQNNTESIQDKSTKNKPVNKYKPKIADENIKTIKNSLEKSSGSFIQENEKINENTSNDTIEDGSGDCVYENSRKKSSGSSIQDDEKINENTSNYTIENCSGDCIFKNRSKAAEDSHKKHE